MEKIITLTNSIRAKESDYRYFTCSIYCWESSICLSIFAIVVKDKYDYDANSF